MKLHRESFVRELLRDERGQTLVFVVLGLTAILGLGAISMEVGHSYYAYGKLKASTSNAALAGAAGLPDTTAAAANVTAYSSMANDKNATGLLQNVSAKTTFLCLNAVTNLGAVCATASGTAGGYNAVSVTQTAQIPLWFGKLVGVPSFNITATSTAATKGGPNTPWNIAIILDTTGSMGYSDSGVQCNGTQISCALKGVQALLSDLYPCTSGLTCTTGVANVDSVSLYVFPPVLTSTVGLDYCSGGSGWGSNGPTTEYYMVPTLNSSWTYQVIPFSNDYRTNDAATTLNTSANIVKATGYSGTNCSGIQTGGSTYYAQVIYQAQSDLIAQQIANPGSQNAMIILSDGDATATVTTSWGGGISSNSWLQPSSANSLNGISGNNPKSYTYPSAVGECGQAVVAAQAAAAAKTTVYTIGYGSELSGCTSDQTYSATVTTGGGSWTHGDTPCQALAAMASAPIDFYSDNANGCKATVPTNAAITSLTAIFHQITGGLTVPRLIPNGLT